VFILTADGLEPANQPTRAANAVMPFQGRIQDPMRKQTNGNGGIDHWPAPLSSREFFLIALGAQCGGTVELWKGNACMMHHLVKLRIIAMCIFASGVARGFFLFFNPFKVEF
jgi:hypothetical protein